MPKTISFHCGSTYSRGHNIRDKRYTAEQKHIDKELTKHNEVLYDCSVREKYNEIFQSAVEDYNAHQSRADRKIDNYYLKVKNDKRKNAVYEVIVQIGDKDDTGNLSEKEKNVLRDYAQSWEKRNPNLKLIGAYIHADEPNGTVHAHIDFIPVAQSNRGMRLQNSFSKALEQQGHIGTKATQTAQMSWQQTERKCLEQLCKQYGILAKANQGLTHAHLSDKEYQRLKNKLTEKALEELENEINPLRAKKMAQIDELNSKLKNISNDIKATQKDKLKLDKEIDTLINQKNIILNELNSAEYYEIKDEWKAVGFGKKSIKIPKESLEKIVGVANNTKKVNQENLNVARERDAYKKQMTEIIKENVTLENEVKVLTKAYNESFSQVNDYDDFLIENNLKEKFRRKQAYKDGEYYIDARDLTNISVQEFSNMLTKNNIFYQSKQIERSGISTIIFKLAQKDKLQINRLLQQRENKTNPLDLTQSKGRSR